MKYTQLLEINKPIRIELKIISSFSGTLTQATLQDLIENYPTLQDVVNGFSTLEDLKNYTIYK